MGFRGVFISEDRALVLPLWFRTKWDEFLRSKEDGHLPLSTKQEIKHYLSGEEIERDLQRVVRAAGLKSLLLVWLFECGGVTRAEIFPDRIIYTEPVDWKVVEEPEHHDWCRRSCRHAGQPGATG